MVDRDPASEREYLRDVQYVDGTKLGARASLHDRFSTAPTSFVDFEAALIEWPAAPVVLDCGTGPGRFWASSRIPRTADLTLTDLSAGMVSAAVESVRGLGYRRVGGEQCDVRELPFDDRSFDVVVANHMLYHVADPAAAVAELARVVRDDGMVLVSTNGAGHMGELSSIVEEVFGRPTDGAELSANFGIDTGEAILRRWFSSIEWHVYDNDLVVGDADAVMAYALSIPPGEFATDAEVAQLAEAVDRRLVDGLYRIRTRTGAFVARVPRRSRVTKPPEPDGGSAVIAVEFDDGIGDGAIAGETQNVYDDPGFLAGYRQLDRQVRGLDGAAEWPAMRSMLPAVAGAAVVDLGCGFGWFSRWAAESGATSVLGLDVSTKMLEQATADTPNAVVEYRRADLNSLELPSRRFHLAYSSLALHYVADLGRLLRTVSESLVDGGEFVFSVEHPILSAPSMQRFEDRDDGRRVWPLEDYLVEGARETSWFVDGVIKHHRTIATHVNELVRAGLDVVAIDEWGPEDARLPGSNSDDRHRPWFLLVHARRTHR